MRKTKKTLASLAIAGMTLSMVPFNVFAASPVPTRISGNTAEQTAAQIADQTGYTGAAILASSTSYGMVDALTAGPLAASLKAPILLTGSGDILDAATKAELAKLEVKKVYVTSGTAVIKQGVIDELKGMGIEVEALGGYDRAETSVNIAKKMTGVSKVAVANTVVDALSIAAVASAANQPILLTDRDALPSSVAAYLSANPGITASDVIGGTGVISDAVIAGLPSAVRHAGMTAYDTNNQVIQDFAAAIQFDNVYVANGITGIDALAGAPLAAQTKSPIVLTDGQTVPAAAAFTYSKSTAGTVVTALGGEAVVPENIRVGVAEGKITNVDLAIVSISSIDDSNRYLEITFSKPVIALQPADIMITNADTLARYGVKEVQMSSNGLTATVELYARDDDDTVLAYLQDYIVKVNANGTLLTATFNRPYSFKVRIQDINVADKEIVGYIDKGTNASGKVTLDVLDSLDFDYQGALGELVQVWYNGDNELVNYKILSTDAKYDAIEITDDDEIKLLGEDEKYDISDEEYTNTSKDKFAFYLDGEKVDNADMDELVDKKFNFAKVGFDTAGDIEFVSAYSLKDFLIVDSVDEDEVVGIDGSSSFDAEDATIVKDGKVIDLDDLEEGDLLFFSDDADDEDGYAEVLNKVAATGEIDEVYEDSIEVDGEIYVFDYDEETADDFDYAQQAVYINEDGEVDDVDSDAAEELQAAGEVSLYTDYAGNLIYISGDTAFVEGNTKVAVLTKDIVGYTAARDKVEIETLNQDEDEETYDMDLEDFDIITVDGQEYDIDNDGDDDWTASLNDDKSAIVLSDNTGDEDDIEISFDEAGSAGRLVKLHLDDDGNLEELEFFSTGNEDTGFGDSADGLEAGDSYLHGYKMMDSTLMFDATDEGVNTDADDYNVETFGDYDGAEISEGNFIYNDDQEVIAVWYSETNSDDTTYEEAVVTKVLRNTDKEIVSLSVWAGGEEKTYEADDVTGFKSNSDLDKGDVVILEFDENSDVVQDIATLDHDITNDGTKEFGARVVTGLSVGDKDVNVGDKEVKTSNGRTYKLADKGLVLDATDTTDITKESLTDLRGETNVTVVLDSKTGSYAKFFIIGDAVDLDAGEALADAKDAVEAYEALPLTTQAEIDAAKASDLDDKATAAITKAIVAGAAKADTDALTARVAAMITKINNAVPGEEDDDTLTASYGDLLGVKYAKVTLSDAGQTVTSVTVDGAEAVEGTDYSVTSGVVTILNVDDTNVLTITAGGVTYTVE